MAIFSRLSPAIRAINPWLKANGVALKAKKSQFTPTIAQIRGMASERTMFVSPTKFVDKKFKDSLHFYFFIGAVPLGILIFLVNTFIGPAELTECPSDYEPKHWEYYPHPIQRWFARYVYTNPQQEYEKYMHFIQEEHEKVQLHFMEQKMKDLISERGDYQAWYYLPVTAKYHRKERKLHDELKETLGD